MADTLDIVTFDAVRAGLNVPSDRETLLAGYITAVSRHIDDLCGPVVKRTVTAEAHHGGTPNIVLRVKPVLSVTTVTENGTTLAAGSYHLDAESGLLERLAAGQSPAYYSFWWWWGRWNIVVTYVAGRYDTTDLVDPVFAEAAKMAVASLWTSQQAIGGTGTFGAYQTDLDQNSIVPGGTQYVLPRPAYMLLSPYIQTRAGVA